MTLIKYCLGQFSAVDRVRGAMLGQRSCVELTAVGQDGAMAIVEDVDNQKYIVGLDFTRLSRKSLGVHCDCSRFENGHPCKHLWVVIKKIDADYEILQHPIGQLTLNEIDVTTLDTGDERQRRKTTKAKTTRPHQPSLVTKSAIAVEPRAQQAQRTATAALMIDNVKVRSSKTEIAEVAGWKQSLHRLATASAAASLAPPSSVPSGVFGDVLTQQQHWFLLSLARPENQVGLYVEVLRSTRKADGQWSRPTPCSIGPRDVSEAIDEHERAVLLIMKPELNVASPYGYGYSYNRSAESGAFNVPRVLVPQSLKLLQATGRFAWKLGDGRHFEDARPVQHVDMDGEPWRLLLTVAPNPAKDSEILLTANLQRDSDRLAMTRVMLASDAGYALLQAPSGGEDQETASLTINAMIVKIDGNEAASLRAWQKTGPIAVPKRSLNTLLSELATSHSSFDIAIDESLPVEQVTDVPSGRCLLQQRKSNPSLFDASLLLRYRDQDIAFDSPVRWWWDSKDKQLRRRDLTSEQSLLHTIPADAFGVLSLPKSTIYGGHQPGEASLWLSRDSFLDTVEKLRQANWEVLAEGLPIRIATDFNITVTSGTDWFDLHAEAVFDGITASLPQLLAALRSGNHTFILDDGSCGMLPEAWLKKFAGLRASGELVEGGVRFGRTQALLLDAMLAEQDNVSRDHSFSDFCAKLKNFEGIAPASPPESFVGTMRPYQQLGLGWFEFLREFRFGGCLADDMGLGKTIQVLALLESRRVQPNKDSRRKKSESRKPSLVVVPKSLIFNWIDEAKRFTPNLRVLNYTGTDRNQRLADSQQDQDAPLDLILTTYGTLRRDAVELRETEFDYVILDEAQAIKNPQSQAAKASRLLRGEHRLAMTGTPVENHLGDLWSLFDFLNPGMLGAAPRIAQLPDDEDRQRITHVSQSLRPFILRRTKAQVLTELPEKMEQTLACEMEPKQRKLYSQLKEHYRLHLSKKMKELGLKRSKIHVLEALLRLRQAACDPRLVNPDCGVTGAKLTSLLEQLEEIVGEGHKALVFSQFTKLLALVRKEFDARGWKYEYLDGKTNNRSEHVKNFQENDDCKLFLISLKAGGNGLNLTAADYVFILDPWWNPAVEAQAIDRAHRMGQTKSVMAYRMICEDTVEEKIIALQQSKRDLADAIISQDKSLISELTAEDLQQLLS